MGSEKSTEQEPFVDQLADHARQLQREARAAISRGDYARAAELVGNAEMLAEDVSNLVDAIAERQSHDMMRLVVDSRAARPAAGKRRRGLAAIPPRRIRAALGASVAMSLALVEC